MRILLDTCAFLWLASDAPDLSQTARNVFQDVENEVFLSSLSAWEVMVKNRLGKLPLPEPAAQFIQRQRKDHLINTLPLDELSVCQLANLPDYHRDPFDRMLICQAIEHDFTIMTPDEAITDYPVATLW
ncbi:MULTISPECIES: type II toxin-antitoxin system VapC family toxin [Thiorhodovibrio]|uniref:type II toxin-antitoxin system VapC family toxin n=1 Tax=Thiorhodovibrio TaxID=61593 RepID=UPI001911484E|nr:MULTISPECIES: type II toxin-antitoxin system VapC family toxin [Thiorhodovibrio]MBK5968061.1 PIN domain nuclease [Thiorhodovibrio winogradskyi]WPL11878.1 PIN domain protein [Thiorhodovibrio litoralis]